MCVYIMKNIIGEDEQEWKFYCLLITPFSSSTSSFNVRCETISIMNHRKYVYNLINLPKYAHMYTNTFSAEWEIIKLYNHNMKNKLFLFIASDDLLCHACDAHLQFLSCTHFLTTTTNTYSLCTQQRWIM